MTLMHYRELVAWQKAMDLVVAVYDVTRSFPKEETYGITAQVRRSAVSVPSNIAEGQGRGTPDEFKRFLRVSNGSRQEMETQIIVGGAPAHGCPGASRPDHRNVPRGRPPEQRPPACPLTTNN